MKLLINRITLLAVLLSINVVADEFTIGQKNKAFSKENISIKRETQFTF